MEDGLLLVVRECGNGDDVYGHGDLMFEGGNWTVQMILSV